MSYRRIRRYRRKDARRYRRLLGQPRPGRMLMAALLAAALTAGLATVSAPHIKAMLSAASKPEGPPAAGEAAGPQAAGNPERLRAGGSAGGLPEACAAAAGARPARTKSCPPATSPRLPAANAN